MEDFYHFLITDPNAKKAVVFGLWVIIGVLIVLAYAVVRSILQGRTFTVGKMSLGGGSKKKDSKLNATTEAEPSQNESTLVELPKNQEELEELIRFVWDDATEAESERLWNLITLLRDVYVFDNTVLLRLTKPSKSPHEVWKTESRSATRSFKDIEKCIGIAMNVISDVTRGDDINSKRRASVALRNKDNFLYIVMRDHHSQAHERTEKFFISEAGPEKGIAGFVAASRKSIRIPNVLKDPRFINFNTTPKYKSLLCVPILAEDYLFGTFSIDSTAEDAYTQEEEELANVFASSIATSLIALMLRHDKH